MDIDAQIEKVRSEAARKIRRLREKQKKEEEKLETEGRKKVCDFIVGIDKNLQAQFITELEKGETLKLWRWLRKRADTALSQDQKLAQGTGEDEGKKHDGTVGPRRAENA